MNKKILDYINNLSNDKKIQKLLIEIVGTILLKQKNIDIFIKENNDKIIHIRDWIYSVVENNEQWKTPRVLTLEALFNTANKYFEKKNNKLQTIELDEQQEKLIADLGEYYVVQMLTAKALDNESKQMQHCIGHGHYDKKLNDDDYQYLSLRDRFNKAHATLEIKNNKIIQLQGKQNNAPDKKYLDYIIDFIKNNQLEFNSNKYGIFFNKTDNKIYSVNELPDNCEIDESFNFEQLNKLFNLEYIPNNFTVNKDLYLFEFEKIKNIPLFIKVKENLYIEGKSNNDFSTNLLVDHQLSISDLNVPSISGNIKCETISINIEQLKLINNNIEFEFILIRNSNYVGKFAKKEFYKLFYENGQKIEKIYI